MISDEYKCIFVEVPKTGSTSIRKAIGFSETPHMSIKEIKKEFLRRDVSPSNQGDITEFQDYFKFGFVRNPWDRIVSLYNRQEGIIMSDKMRFEEFVDWINYSSDTSIYPTQHKNQLDWFLDDNKQLAVDFIGRFERLNEDWKTICRKLKIDFKLEHHNKNENNTKHYTDYYNDETIGVIAEKFKVDIDYFEYKFGE